MKKPVPEADA